MRTALIVRREMAGVPGLAAVSTSKTAGTPIRRARICSAGWRPWDRADLPFAGNPRSPSIRRPNFLCRAAGHPVTAAANGRLLAATFSVRPA